jgi:polysaccharide export outer membrane protein
VTRRNLFAAVLCVCLVGGVGCHTKVPTYDYSQEPDPRKTEYVLGIGDRLAINVWEQNALSTEAIIRPDGTVTMPLLGDLHASGETPSSLKAKIKERLHDFVKQEAEVTIAVTAANSYRFTVSGEVERAGIYNSPYYVTVAEAIALSGGFTRFAKRNEMVLMRRDPKSGEVRSIPLAYDLIASGKRPDMNLVITAGDSLYVP